MSMEHRIETEKKYKKEDGEPSAIKRPVWNGELMVYMRKVLNEISNENKLNVLLVVNQENKFCGILKQYHLGI